MSLGANSIKADDHLLDVVDTAVGAGTFNTLAAALSAADLIDVLKGEGPFTVFAPTDEAFSKLPEGTVESLLYLRTKINWYPYCCALCGGGNGPITRRGE